MNPTLLMWQRDGFLIRDAFVHYDRFLIMEFLAGNSWKQSRATPSQDGPPKSVNFSLKRGAECTNSNNRKYPRHGFGLDVALNGSSFFYYGFTCPWTANLLLLHLLPAYVHLCNSERDVLFIQLHNNLL